MQNGNTTHYYDGNGRNNGRATTNGNTTRYYNSNGTNAGRMVK